MSGLDYRSDLKLVFASVDGDYLKPDSVTSEVCRFAKACGLKGISLDTLRHTHGSRLLSLGTPLPAVSKRLGQSSAKITANIYSHALPSDEEHIASRWDSYVSSQVLTKTDTSGGKEKTDGSKWQHIRADKRAK